MTFTSIASDSDWPYLFPPVRKTGDLVVSKTPPHKIHFQAFGNPEGEPVIVLHGGPGGGSRPKTARLFDPERYYVIIADQRGCGGQ